MAAVFERSGVKFQFPENWAVDTEDSDTGGWTVSVQSPVTAFVVVSLRADGQTTAEVAAEALAALKAEYADAEAEAVVESLAGRPAVGHDVDFLTLDTTTTCWTRCVDTADGPLLVLCQVSDFDRAVNEPVLNAITTSLEITDE